MKIHGAPAGGHLDSLEPLRNVDAATKRNHELVIAALQSAEIGYFGILIVRRSKSDLDTRVGLKKAIKSVAVSDCDQRRGGEIVSAVSHWRRRAQADANIVAVEIAVLTEGLRSQQGDDRKEKASRYHKT